MAREIIIYRFVDPSDKDIKAILAGHFSEVRQVHGGVVAFAGEEPTEVPAEISAKAEKKLIESANRKLTDFADALPETNALPETKRPRGVQPDPHCVRSKILLYMRDFPNTTKSQLAKRFSWNHVNGLMTEGKNPLLTPVPYYEVPKFTALGEERLSYIESKLLQEAAA